MTNRLRTVRAAAWLPAFAITLALVAGCDATEQPPSRETPPDSAATSTANATFDAPAEFPLAFSTTTPPGLSAQTEPAAPSSNIAGAIRFAGPEDPDVTYLHVVALDSAWDRNDAVGLVRAISTHFGVIGSDGLEYQEARPAPGHSWAFTGYQLRGVVQDRAVEGWLSLGEHGGRYFYIMAIYPQTEAAEVQPLFQQVLDGWVWRDTGSRLGAAAAPAET